MRSAPLVSQKKDPKVLRISGLRAKIKRLTDPTIKTEKWRIVAFLCFKRSIPRKRKMRETKAIRKDKRFIVLQRIKNYL